LYDIHDQQRVLNGVEPESRQRTPRRYVNKEIQEYNSVTHSRYEYSTPTWTKFPTDDPNEQWNILTAKGSATFRPACPYMYPDGRRRRGVAHGRTPHHPNEMLLVLQ
jgi:hypothetical protein